MGRGCCLTLFIMSPSMWWTQAYLCNPPWFAFGWHPEGFRVGFWVSLVSVLQEMLRKSKPE